MLRKALATGLCLFTIAGVLAVPLVASAQSATPTAEASMDHSMPGSAMTDTQKPMAGDNMQATPSSQNGSAQDTSMQHSGSAMGSEMPQTGAADQAGWFLLVLAAGVLLLAGGLLRLAQARRR